MIPLKKFQKLCDGSRDSRRAALRHLVGAGLMARRDDGVISVADGNPYVEAFFNGTPAEEAKVDALVAQVDEVLDGHDLRIVTYALAQLLISAIRSTEDDAEFMEHIRTTTYWTDDLVTDRFGSGGTA
jgi:hypothetical protein